MTTTETELEHGKAATYRGTPNRKGCRCDLCRKAFAEAQREYTARRAEELGACGVDGCDRGQYAKGICRAHYVQQLRRSKLAATP